MNAVKAASACWNDVMATSPSMISIKISVPPAFVDLSQHIWWREVVEFWIATVARAMSGIAFWLFWSLVTSGLLLLLLLHNSKW